MRRSSLRSAFKKIWRREVKRTLRHFCWRHEKSLRSRIKQKHRESFCKLQVWFKGLQANTCIYTSSKYIQDSLLYRLVEWRAKHTLCTPKPTQRLAQREHGPLHLRIYLSEMLLGPVLEDIGVWPVSTPGKTLFIHPTNKNPLLWTTTQDMLWVDLDASQLHATSLLMFLHVWNKPGDIMFVVLSDHAVSQYLHFRHLGHYRTPCLRYVGKHHMPLGQQNNRICHLLPAHCAGKGKTTWSGTVVGSGGHCCGEWGSELQTSTKFGNALGPYT